MAAHAADANVRIVDMRRGGYQAGHVPGSVYLQPEAIRDANSPPSFLPTPEAWQVGEKGPSNLNDEFRMQNSE